MTLLIVNSEPPILTLPSSNVFFASPKVITGSLTLVDPVNEELSSLYNISKNTSTTPEKFRSPMVWEEKSEIFNF